MTPCESAWERGTVTFPILEGCPAASFALPDFIDFRATAGAASASSSEAAEGEDGGGEEGVGEEGALDFRFFVPEGCALDKRGCCGMGWGGVGWGGVG